MSAGWYLTPSCRGHARTSATTACSIAVASARLLTSAAPGKEGIKLENRYHFTAADPYDVGRLSFVSLGYIPTENLVGGNGAGFRPGLSARTYLADDLPISWFWSYLYAGQQITGQN